MIITDNPKRWSFSATVEVTGDVIIEAETYEEAVSKFEDDPMGHMTIEYETVIAIHDWDDKEDEDADPA